MDKNFNWIKLVRFGIAISALAILGTAGVSAQVQIAGATTSLSDTVGQTSRSSIADMDIPALRNQLDTFGNFLNRGIQLKFNQPFSLLQDAKGIYLPGYGVAFHMEVNLQTLRLMSPFDMQPYTPDEIVQARKLKMERIHQLESILKDLLLERGGTLTAMAPAQNIAFVEHIFRLPSESRDLPSQILISDDRKALLDYQAKRVTAEQFQSASTLLEF